MNVGIDKDKFVLDHELTQSLQAFSDWLEARYKKEHYSIATFLLPKKISFYRRIAQLAGKEFSSAFHREFKKDDHFTFSPPAKILLKNLFIFGRDWAKVFFKFFIYKTHNNSNEKTLNVFKMHGLESIIGKDEFNKFISFCNDTAISPLHDKESKLICWGNFKNNSFNDRFIFTKDPFVFMPFNNLKFKDIVSFIFWHLYFGFVYLCQAVFNKEFLLLSKDFAWLSFWKTINENEFIKNYMLENSAFDNQEIFIEELPNRLFKTHMIFYSINHMGLKYSGIKGTSNSPQFRYMVADYAWVWNNIQMNWLRANSALREMINVGSIHFMPLGKKVDNQKDGQKFQIAIFDTTPYADEYLLKVLGWKGSFFHSELVMFRFLKDLMLIKEFFPDVQIILKTKRGFNKNHSTIYKLLCEELYSKGIVEMYDHDLDVVGLIDSSDLVISAPFTSPGFVASERGVKSAFYAPGDIIEDNLNLKSENINFINSTDELLRLIQEMKRKK